MYICIYVYMYICIYVDLLFVALIIKVGFCHRKVLPRSHTRSPKPFKSFSEASEDCHQKLARSHPKRIFEGFKPQIQVTGQRNLGKSRVQISSGLLICTLVFP